MQYPKGHEFEFKPLKPSQIRTDPLYQRDLDQKRVARIVKEFSGDTFSEPKVSFRDGVYWVFDGQHSIAAWRKLHNNQDKQILCKVFRGMTWLEEKECFVRQNGIAKDPTTGEKLKAEYNSGNPGVVDMVNAANSKGVAVSFNSRSTAKAKCIALGALYDQYKLLGRDHFCEMLHTIMEAWEGDPQSLTQFILRGLGKFYKVYYGEFRRSDLLKTLKKNTADFFIREGRDISGTVANRYAMVFLRAYNKQRTSNRLENKL